jgi:hypothetical protein
MVNQKGGILSLNEDFFIFDGHNNLVTFDVARQVGEIKQLQLFP